MSKVFKIDKIFEVDTDIKGFKIKNQLGEGRYGIAYLACNSRGEKVVIKQLKKAMIKKCKEKLKYERIILESLNNSMFPKYIDSFEKDNRKGYIIEYKTGKTFDEVLYKDNYVFDLKEIYEVGSKLIQIIEILYNSNIVHKDIRVSNVVLNEQGEIALIDFGLARFIDNKKYKADMDFWYLGDFLIHLYYSSYEDSGCKERPWYEELNISEEEKIFIKRLMGIEEKFENLQQLKSEFDKIKSNLYVR